LFEIIGTVNFKGDSVPLTGKHLLPVQHGWAQSPAKNIKTANYEVVYLEHVNSPLGYATDGSRAVLVIGELRLRMDAAGIPAADAIPGGLLSAPALLSMLEAGGESLSDKIKGNYSLVILDQQTRSVQVLNSRFGISPFYYAWNNSLFVFSTSLAAVAGYLDTSPLDMTAIVEQSLFNYPLERRTYYKNISMMLPAECLEVNASGLTRNFFWDVSGLYSSDIYPRQKALDLGSELFHKITNDYAGAGRVRVSFTSGFDSRAIMAVLNKPAEQIQAYSFGIPGSLNVDIPVRICRENGIPFEPITLDERYEQDYAEYATRAILLSDCYSTVERANYPYAFERLAGFSPVVLTGLFGSELMRSFQNVGGMIGAGVTTINSAGDIPAAIEQVLVTGRPRYLQAALLDEAKQEIREDLTALFERFIQLPTDHRFYMLLLTEILRKYFGPELQMERPWGINRFPFLDDEFVEFAFRTPFAGVYSRSLKPTIGNRFHSQYFYAYIIRKYRPELLKALTDHGYAPLDVIFPLALLRIGPQFLYRRWQRQRAGYREFKTEEWTEKLYRQRLFQTTPRAELFSGKLVEDFQNGSWKGASPEFARAASLKLWLEVLGEGMD
jgi:asparagine synthetase B (glutamine-hydrolysing)